LAKRLTEKALTKLWYAKLKKSGFNDIENDKGQLKDWSSRVQRKNEHENLLDSWPGKIAYYDMATTFLNEHSFENNLDKVIWEYHTNGISYRDIVKLLKKVKIEVYLVKVHKIVRRLENIMKKRYLK